MPPRVSEEKARHRREKDDGKGFLIENYFMVYFIRSKMVSGIFAMVTLALAGCGSYAPPVGQRLSPTENARHNDVFATGYDAIMRKYIYPVDIEKIALDGIKGFAAIDPALKVEVRNHELVMSLDGETITTSPKPAPNPTDWARLTTSLSFEARRHSALMRKASAEKIYEAVFDGVLSNLDLFSRYAGADEAKRNRARRDGFGGIGIRFKLKKEIPVVTEVMPRTPAAEAGLRISDQITDVDGESLSKPRAAEVVELLRGPTQSKVTIGLYRPSEDRQFNVILERRHIISPTVYASRQGNILKIRVTGFNQATARNMATSLEEAKAKAAHIGPLSGIVLDIRGNPGGLLKQSVRLADLLLTHGLIVSTRGRHPDSPHYYEAGGRDLANGLPIAVLVDGKSASASEIVAAALQDRGRAVLIGTSSFGKGSVQTVIRLPNDGEITLTWSRFVAPSGYILHGLGVRPSICTSGNPEDIGSLIQSAMIQRLAARKTFVSWRIPGARKKADRQKLRDTCPPERHRKNLEFEIAKRVLDDRRLYAQALELSAGTHQARH